MIALYVCLDNYRSVNLREFALVSHYGKDKGVPYTADLFKTIL